MALNKSNTAKKFSGLRWPDIAPRGSARREMNSAHMTFSILVDFFLYVLFMYLFRLRLLNIFKLKFKVDEEFSNFEKIFVAKFI